MSLVELFPPLSHEVHPADGAGCGHLPLSAAAIAPEETRIWEKENGRTRTDGRTDAGHPPLTIHPILHPLTHSLGHCQTLNDEEYINVQSGPSGFYTGN